MTKYNWNERHIITFPEEKLALATKDLHVYYGQKEAIKGIDMQFEKNKITALIGPSGCGKSTFLRSLNRMNDTIDIAKVTGQILYDGIDVNAKNINVYEMRKHIGMVFQRPNPFVKSIYKNITFAYERAGVKDKQFLDEIVETSLKQAALWDQVKDDLHKSAFTLSGGQQAARASDYTAFFYLGDLIEYDKTNNIFQNAKLQSTSDYVSGHFG